MLKQKMNGKDSLKLFMKNAAFDLVQVVASWRVLFFFKVIIE